MSRQSLVPIVLPADPAAAMEAVTKQYVDARAGSEVEIGTADPIGTNPNAELWFDSDAPGPVSAGVGLPSGGTTGQVLVKQSATDYAAQWGGVVDYAKMPRGLVGRTNASASAYTNATATATPVTATTGQAPSLTVALDPTRWYRCTFSAVFNLNVGDRAFFEFWIGGAFSRIVVNTTVAINGVNVIAHAAWFLQPASAAAVAYAIYGRTTGAATLSCTGASTNSGIEFAIEDIGGV